MKNRKQESTTLKRVTICLCATHIRFSLVIVALSFFISDLKAQNNTSGNTHKTYKISVGRSSNIFSVYDKTVVELNGMERVTVDSSYKLHSFKTELKTGDIYRLKIISSINPAVFYTYPFEANKTEIIDTVRDYDIIQSLVLTHNRIFYKLKIIGLEFGDILRLKDDYGVTNGTSFNTTIRKGGIQGDPLNIYQITGPRPCKIFPLGFIMPAKPELDYEIICDCSKQEVAIPAPKEKYDLVTRNTDNTILNTYVESGEPVIGGDGADEGRYVAFVMYGKDIDSSSGNYKQIFWRDRKLGITKLVSKSNTGAEGKGNSAAPSISSGGRYVVFESYASNLIEDDVNSTRDVFLWDSETGRIRLLSMTPEWKTGNAESYEPVISGDGSTVVFTSGATDIVKLEAVYATPNVFLYSILAGQITLLTKDYETGKAAGGSAPSISEDGSKVAFWSNSSKIVSNDMNNLWDIFLWNKNDGKLKRISITANGGERLQGDESASRIVWPNISGNGEFIVFSTTSPNIVTDDTNGKQDIFLFNTVSGTIKRINKPENGNEPDGDSPVTQGERIGISYDGTWITYNTTATNLGVPKGNIVVQNTKTGKINPITSLTIGSTGRPMITRYGNFIVAGSNEKFDTRFFSSGIFAIYTDINKD